MTDESKSPEPDSGHNEFDQFEKVLKRVLVVPKSEIDAQRSREKQESPPGKTA